MSFASGYKRPSLVRFAIAAVVGLMAALPAVVATPASANSQPAGPPGSSYAASEGQSFTINGYADVTYGVDGRFNRKTHRTGRISCNNSTFGDPKKGSHKSCFTLALVGPAGYSYATTEGSSFTRHDLFDIAYGANGRFNRKYGVTGHIDCNNSTFGDPYRTVHKSCYYLDLDGPTGYGYVGVEGAHIPLTGLVDVAYGDNGKFFRKTAVSGSIDCTNDVFGNPDPGVTKSCYILTLTPPPGFTYAAPENAHIPISGIADVAYGSRGKFKFKYDVTGGIDCTNGVFGNPDPGVQKACFVRSVTGPSGYTFAATEGNSFTISGTADVVYGANGVFSLKLGLTGTVGCNNTTFVNPAPGIQKACFTKPS